MGNFEKLVVLAVLFLSAIVLAVSLNDDGDEVEASGPLSAAAERLEEPTLKPAADGGAPALESSAPKYSLNAVTQPAAPGADREQPAREPGSGWSNLDRLSDAEDESAGADAPILISKRGLTPSAIDDFMIYDVREGDTWNALALTFYGDGRYVTNLRMANEETALEPGKGIFVPVFDLAREASSDRSPLAPETGPAPVRSAPPVAGSGVQAPPAAVPATAVTIGEVYVVKTGDSLSRIAVRAYGNGNLWRPIYDANRDKLRSPDALKVGMRLLIPDPEKASVVTNQDPNRPRVR